MQKKCFVKVSKVAKFFFLRRLIARQLLVLETTRWLDFYRWLSCMASRARGWIISDQVEKERFSLSMRSHGPCCRGQEIDWWRFFAVKLLGLLSIEFCLDGCWLLRNQTVKWFDRNLWYFAIFDEDYEVESFQFQISFSSNWIVRWNSNIWKMRSLKFHGWQTKKFLCFLDK